MKMKKIMLSVFSLAIFWSMPLIAVAENSDIVQPDMSDELKSYSVPMETPDMTTVNPTPQEPETVAPESPPVFPQEPDALTPAPPTDQPPTDQPLPDQFPPDQGAPQTGP